ncbi:sulfatase-like hydrolase/transferase [Ferrimonas pelagia]|uniref:Sulfatase N-terminal domain-containing protein n=1 Tax=Ferrimonas pelagia TaxID=1177826 RepID=A0ABP9EQD8_9GAMM
MSFPQWQLPVLSSAIALGLTACVPSTSLDQPEEVRRPNVVLLFSDDLGYADTGFQNQSQDVETPNLDRLAASGVVFSAGYVTGTVCGPSRAGLMTGRYQQRFGYHENTAPYSRDPNTPVGLELSVPTFANYLQDAGYRTGMVGKWHDSPDEGYWPHQRGFDEHFGFNNGASSYYVGPMNDHKLEYKKEAATYRNGVPAAPFDQYLTDKFGDEAVDYIARNKEDAFFLYVAFNAIHAPMEPKQSDMARFAHIEDESRRKAVAMNYNMDENIGKILDKLDAEGLMEDTIIFFLSDNGGKLNDNHSLNTPLRGEKGSFWEGGIRIPFTVAWNGTIPAGQTIDEPVISLDILTTSLAAAGVAQRDDWQLEGQNLLPLLTGARDRLDDRFLFWANSRGWAVRDRNWKLHVVDQRQKGDQVLLFDLQQDMAEQHELSGQYSEQVARLQAAYRDWDTDNERPRWGRNRKEFPYYNGHHSHEERRARAPELIEQEKQTNEVQREMARKIIDSSNF